MIVSLQSYFLFWKMAFIIGCNIHIAPKRAMMKENMCFRTTIRCLIYHLYRLAWIFWNEYFGEAGWILKGQNCTMYFSHLLPDIKAQPAHYLPHAQGLNRILSHGIYTLLHYTRSLVVVQSVFSKTSIKDHPIAHNREWARYYLQSVERSNSTLVTVV